MSPVAAPASFPNPTSCSFTLPEMRAISAGKGNKQARRRGWDAILAYDLGYELTFAQSAEFDAWYATGLLNGTRFASVKLPGPLGIVARAVKFTSGIQRSLVPAIGYSVSFSLETI